MSDSISIFLAKSWKNKVFVMSYELQLLSAPKLLSTVAQSQRKMTICHSKIGKNEGHGRVD